MLKLSSDVRGEQARLWQAQTAHRLWVIVGSAWEERDISRGF